MHFNCLFTGRIHVQVVLYNEKKKVFVLLVLGIASFFLVDTMYNTLMAFGNDWLKPHLLKLDMKIPIGLVKALCTERGGYRAIGPTANGSF